MDVIRQLLFPPLSFSFRWGRGVASGFGENDVRSLLAWCGIALSFYLQLGFCGLLVSMSCLKLGHLHFLVQGLGSLAFLGPCFPPTPLGLIMIDFVICRVFIFAMGPSPPLCGWLVLAYLLAGLSSLAAFGAVCLTLCVYSSSHVGWVVIFVVTLFSPVYVYDCSSIYMIIYINIFLVHYLICFLFWRLPRCQCSSSLVCRERMSHMLKL